MGIKKWLDTAFPKFRSPKRRKGDLSKGGDDDTESSTTFYHANETETDFVKEFNAREESYRRKEDQDVAVFLALVDKMSVQSLVFILQGHARSMHNVHEFELQTTLKQIKSAEDKASAAEGKKPIVKQLRFAEILGGQQIREEVLEIPHCNDFTAEEKAALWWSDEEMNGIKREAARVVHFFRQHRPEYADSVSMLADSYKPEADSILVDHHMKRLTQNSFPRGLECHIVDAIGDMRENGVKSVLSVQLGHQNEASMSSSGDENEQRDERWTEIRKSYRKASRPGRTLALKLAECDHVEALKSSISSWGTAPEAAKTTRTPRANQGESTSVRR